MSNEKLKLSSQEKLEAYDLDKMKKGDTVYHIMSKDLGKVLEVRKSNKPYHCGGLIVEFQEGKTFVIDWQCKQSLLRVVKTRTGKTRPRVHLPDKKYEKTSPYTTTELINSNLFTSY